MGMRKRINDDPTLINISIKSIRIHEYNKRGGSDLWKGKNGDSVNLRIFPVISDYFDRNQSIGNCVFLYEVHSIKIWCAQRV